MRRAAIILAFLVLAVLSLPANAQAPGWLGIEVETITDALVKEKELPTDLGT